MQHSLRLASVMAIFTPGTTTVSGLDDPLIALGVLSLPDDQATARLRHIQ